MTWTIIGFVVVAVLAALAALIVFAYLGIVAIVRAGDDAFDEENDIL